VLLPTSKQDQYAECQELHLLPISYFGELRWVLSNLARCPAWISSGPRVHVSMEGMYYDDFQSYCRQVIGAVHSLASKQVHHLCITGFGAVITPYILAVLRRAVGTSLTHLQLVGCHLSPDL
jgi:hypothetical protein